MNIIIGGTHGLGKEIAGELQELQEETFIVGSSYDYNHHGMGMKVDLANMDQAARLCTYIRSLGDNALRGFYWVAGYGYNGDFAEQQDVRDMALVNLTNVLPVAQVAWQKMITQTIDSNFVVVSSTTGVKARPNEAVYAATKHAQVGFTRSLGIEANRLGVPVNVALFLPGGMQTPFWDKNQPDNYDTFLDPEKVAHHIVENVMRQDEPYYEEMIEKGSL